MHLPVNASLFAIAMCYICHAGDLEPKFLVCFCCDIHVHGHCTVAGCPPPSPDIIFCLYSCSVAWLSGGGGHRSMKGQVNLRCAHIGKGAEKSRIMCSNA